MCAAWEGGVPGKAACGPLQIDSGMLLVEALKRRRLSAWPPALPPRRRLAAAPALAAQPLEAEKTSWWHCRTLPTDPVLPPALHPSLCAAAGGEEGAGGAHGGGPAGQGGAGHRWVGPRGCRSMRTMACVHPVPGLNQLEPLLRPPDLPHGHCPAEELEALLGPRPYRSAELRNIDK